jgi:superfamily II DNA or RNA helicase
MARPISVSTQPVKNAVLVASFGTFSTGVNVKRLHHLVFASPSKSRYRVLQSIGRGLRLHASKKVVYVHDVVDDAHQKSYVNYCYKHWAHRAKFYQEEQFPIDLYTHTIEATPYGT